MLICEKLSAINSWGGVIFKDLSVTVGPGSLLLIKGDNGSGKTSLLRIIAGLSAPAKGKISVDFSISPYEHSSAHHIMFIDDKIGLNPNEKIIDHLTFWADLWDTYHMIQAAVYYFNLGDILDIECKYLSQGTKKRVALAKLLCSTSRLWLLDEPENHLDEYNLNLLINCINSRVANQAIVIAATHSNKFDYIGHAIYINDFK